MVIPDTLGYVRTYWSWGSTLDNKELTRYHAGTRYQVDVRVAALVRTSEMKPQQLRTLSSTNRGVRVYDLMTWHVAADFLGLSACRQYGTSSKSSIL